jgi:hypothetical protein
MLLWEMARRKKNTRGGSGGVGGSFIGREKKRGREREGERREERKREIPNGCKG